MLKFLKWLYLFFSPYVNFFERKVDKFFRNVKSTDNINTIKQKLLSLMQENLIVTNVWLEKKYKGYKYLKKSVRRKMYKDVGEILKKFQEHCAKENISIEDVKKYFQTKGWSLVSQDEEKVKYLFEIMSFLRPDLYYHYIQTASFGKLLRDPNKEKLEGDCNQIVTLYAYLFSLKFPLSEVSIKLLPEHVCLHFREVDIEATNATFQKYTESNQVLPITEIISTNLLDLTDFREELASISERAMVKSAQLAFAISSLRELVAKNLNIAYQNLGIAAINSKNFKTAIFYFEKTDRKDLLLNAYRSSAIHYLNLKDFERAKFYAEKTGDGELNKSVQKAFYAKEYNELAKKVNGVKTEKEAKAKRGTYQRMLQLAEKMGDGKLVQNLRETLREI